MNTGVLSFFSVTQTKTSSNDKKKVLNEFEERLDLLCLIQANHLSWYSVPPTPHPRVAQKNQKCLDHFSSKFFPLGLFMRTTKKNFSSIRVDLGVAQEPYFFKKSPNWGQLDRKCFFRTFYFGLCRGPHIWEMWAKNKCVKSSILDWPDKILPVE